MSPAKLESHPKTKTLTSKVPKLMINLPPLRLRVRSPRPALPSQILSIKLIAREPRTRRSTLRRRSHKDRTRPRHRVPADILRGGGPVQLTGDLFFIDHDDHPDADFLVAAQQRRAVDPAGLAFDVSLDAAEPGDLCGDACAVRKGIEESLTHAFRSADALEEFGLEEAGDSKGGGCERNAEGWVGADEEVLWSGIVSWSCFSS
jgi:hypothetical protein